MGSWEAYVLKEPAAGTSASGTAHPDFSNPLMLEKTNCQTLFWKSNWTLILVLRNLNIIQHIWSLPVLTQVSRNQWFSPPLVHKKTSLKTYKIQREPINLPGHSIQAKLQFKTLNKTLGKHDMKCWSWQSLHSAVWKMASILCGMGSSLSSLVAFSIVALQCRIIQRPLGQFYVVYQNEDPKGLSVNNY